MKDLRQIEEFYQSRDLCEQGFPGQLTTEFQSMLREAHSAANAGNSHFYHTMEYPDGELREGAWDLRGGERDYLGHLNPKGQRVLELGPATGYLGFFMERASAHEVVAFDLALGGSQDLLPIAGIDLEEHRRAQNEFYTKIRNSWWYSKAKLGSELRIAYGDIYKLPSDLGMFDVALLACILLHLSNPFAALCEAARITRKAIVVTDLVQRIPMVPTESEMYFNPGGPEKGNLVDWWGISPGSVTRMLKVLGFTRFSTWYHRQKHRRLHVETAELSDQWLFTVVGERPDSNVEFHSIDRHTWEMQSVLRSRFEGGAFAEVKNQLDSVLSSTSWRITAPVRWLLDRVRR